MKPYERPIKNNDYLNKPITVEIKTTNEIIKFESIKECAKYFDKSHSSIGQVLRGSGIYKKIYKIYYTLPSKWAIT